MNEVKRRQLRKLRQELGLSIAAAAAQVHVAPRTWIRWETGEIPVSDTAAHLFCAIHFREWPSGKPEAIPPAIEARVLRDLVAAAGKTRTKAD